MSHTDDVSFTDDVLLYIHECNEKAQECYSTHVMTALQPKDSELYGMQRKVSQAVAALRRRGLLDDVAARCPTCHSALTRHVRNVPLNVTAAGRGRVSALEQG